MPTFPHCRSFVTDTNSRCFTGCIQATSRASILTDARNPFEASRFCICIGLGRNQHVRHVWDEPLSWHNSCPCIQQAGNSIPNLSTQKPDGTEKDQGAALHTLLAFGLLGIRPTSGSAFGTWHTSAARDRAGFQQAACTDGTFTAAETTRSITAWWYTPLPLVPW